MNRPDERNYEVADRLTRLGNGKSAQPKHLRMMGGYLLFAAAFLAGINVYSWTKNELWPKALVIAPAVFLLGVWLLFDAKALANGTRQHQKAILWACIGIGSTVGFGVLHSLTGRFF
jgi:hypothetical protein